ncbi:hypothetical protein OROGR_024952 [Orobanche gracilis]
MDRNRDLRRAAMSTVDGFPRRRQKVSTLRDLTEEDRQMEFQEIVRSRDRAKLQKKDRDRDFPKRRRVDNRSVVQQRNGGGGGSYRGNVSTTSVGKEYIEDEEETRILQQNRTNDFSPESSFSNSLGLRTFRSSPVLGTSVEEVLGVPIPRRARSASAKKLHEYQKSGKGKSGKDLSHQKISPSPETASPIGSGDSSPSSSGASMKNKMKYVSKLNPSSTIQNDIEIEVAEALFDLMKQSHSLCRSSEREEKVERDSTNANDGDIKRCTAERDEDEKDPIVKVNAKTILADSMKELNKRERIEKENFPAKRKVGSPKETESLSCVKVNVCDIRDSTEIKSDYASSVVEAKEGKIEIDLMALPFLPSSPERDALLAIDPRVMIQDVQKKSETVSKDEIRLPGEKIGVTRDTQVPNLYLKKHRYDISSVVESTTTTQQLWGQKEPKNQSPNSSFSFPIGKGSWHGLLPHTGYMPCHRAFLPVDESARFSMTMQPPPFKFSQPRRKTCATHQYIAHNIHNHQQLTEKSLLSGPSDAATLYGTKPSNFKSGLPEQRFITGNPLLGDFEGGSNYAVIHSGGGKDKSSEFAADFNATSSKSVLQQGPNQSTALKFLNSRFTFPFGHYQSTTMAPANSLGPPQSSTRDNVSLPSNSNLSRNLSTKNSSFPGVVTSNHSIFPSDEAAASYMAILQNSGCPFPIPANITLPSFKGSSSMPFLNSSFYSASLFNISQNQHLLSLPSQKSQLPIGTKVSDNKIGASFGGDGSESHSVKPNSKNSNNDIPQPFPLSFGSNASSAPLVSLWTQNPSIFQIPPEMSLNGGKTLPTSEGKSQTRSGQSPLAVAPSKFDSSFLSPSLNSVPIPNFYHNQHQMQQIQIKASDYASMIPKWDNFPRAATVPQQGSSESPVHGIPQVKNSQAQNMLSYNSSLSKSTSNIQRNASIFVGKGASTVPVLANCL